MLAVWFIISVVTAIIADNLKNRNPLGWFFLGVLLGPVALIIILLLPKLKSHPDELLEPSLELLRKQLSGVKNEIGALNNKLQDIEKTLAGLETEEEKKTEFEAIPQSQELPVDLDSRRQNQQETAEDYTEPETHPADKPGTEINIGRSWLNKIGIATFSIGVAFLLNYTFIHIGPAAKVLLGYLTALSLFGAGVKFEKTKKFVNYGRVLLGGSWAIAYLTTYAMYHFEPAKIINSEILDLILLAVVAFGIIAHSLLYKSKTLTAVALFVGFFTSTLGDINSFTIISTVLLAAVVLIVVYKLQWIKFVLLGIILVYLPHLIWVIRQIYSSTVPVGVLNVKNVCFLLNLGFLLVYWTMFVSAIHIIRGKGDQTADKSLAAANFLNFLLFFFMAYPKFYFFYPGYKFYAVLCLGLVYLGLAGIMSAVKRDKLFVSNIVTAVSLLTMSIYLKFLPCNAMVIWLIELPFLIFIGFIFNRKSYRYLGLGLSILLFLRLISSDWFASEKINFLSWSLNYKIFLSFTGSVSTAACFSLYRFFSFRGRVVAWERNIKNLYSGLFMVCLTVYISEIANPPWLTLSLSLEALSVFILGVFLSDKYIRLYATAVLTLAMTKFYAHYSSYRQLSVIKQLLATWASIVPVFAQYFIYRNINKKKSLAGGGERMISSFLFFAASFMLVFAAVVYIHPKIWVTLSLGVISIVTLLWGIKISSKSIRAYSLIVLFFAAVRFAFIDNYYFVTNEFFKWFLILMKLACGYTVYLIYWALPSTGKKTAALFVFYISVLLTVLAIFEYINTSWIAVALGIFGVVLFGLGFSLRERTFRRGGFIVFGTALIRIIFIDISRLPTVYKIASFIIIGLLFLGVSFIYTKYTDKYIKK